MTKKWMALALSFVMVFTMIPVGAYAETTTFSDMPNDWSTVALQNAVDNGLLNGADGKIMPKDNLTRAQMATIINRAFGAEKTASLAGFADVAQSDWFYVEMAKAVAMETFQGSGRSLNPNDPITREQAFAVIARALNLGASTVAPAGFTDLSEISSWATGEVYSLVNNGYIQGSNGKLNPQGYITRAEFAQVMDNILKQYVNVAGEYTINVAGNAMINTPGVTLTDSTITGDLVIGDGVGEGDVTLEDVVVTGRLLVRGGGENSIIIKGDSVIGSITVAKIDGTVRVFAEDGTEIGEVIVDGKDDVIIEGSFADIIVLANDITVWATDATIETATVEGDDSRIVIGAGSTVEKLVVKGAGTDLEISGKVKEITVEESAEDTVVTVEKDGEVDEITVNSAGTLIEGEGEVDEVQANADDVVVETEGTKVSAARGTEGVMAGDEEVNPGETIIVGEEEEEPRAGGGGGGGSTTPDPDPTPDPDEDDEDEEDTDPTTPSAITVSAISVTPKALTLTVGDTGNITATVEPEDATNKDVTWESSDDTVATVDANGLVTAVAAGTATITVTTVDGSFTATTAVTVEEIAAESFDVTDAFTGYYTGEGTPTFGDLQKEDFGISSITGSIEEGYTITLEGTVKVFDDNHDNPNRFGHGGTVALLGLKYNLPGAFANEAGLTDVGIVWTSPIQSATAFDAGYTWRGSVDTGNYDSLILTSNVYSLIDQDQLKFAVNWGGQKDESEGYVEYTLDISDVDFEEVKVTGVSLDEETLTLTAEETAELTATVAPTNAVDKSVSWTSSDESVATVDENGLVTAEAAGTATITATAGGKTASTTVTIGDSLVEESESIQAAIDAATAGDTILVAEGTYVESLIIPSGKEGLVLKSVSGADATVIDGNIALGADNITIEGFTIGNSGARNGYVGLEGTDGSKITNNIINGSKATVSIGNTTGNTVDSVTIEGNTINGGTIGLYPTSGSNITINNNIIDSGNGEIIWIHGAGFNPTNLTMEIRGNKAKKDDDVITIHFKPISINEVVDDLEMISTIENDNEPVKVVLGWVKTVGATADFTTIQAAIDAAEDGDTIQIAAGTYDESIVVPEEKVRSITILGADSATIPTSSDVDGTIITGGMTFGRDISTNPTIEKSITVKGITFSGGSGLIFKDIRNVTVENNKFIGITAGDAAVTVLDPSPNDRDGVTTISNNYIDGVSGLGIYVRRPAPTTVIEGNHVEATDHNSIQVVGVSAGPSVTIEGNTLINWDKNRDTDAGRAIRINFDPVDASTALTVTGNTFNPGDDTTNRVDPEYVKISGVHTDAVSGLIAQLQGSNTWTDNPDFAVVILVNDMKGALHQ